MAAEVEKTDPGRVARTASRGALPVQYHRVNAMPLNGVMSVRTTTREVAI